MGYFLHRQMSDEAYYLALARRPRQPGAFSKYRGVVKSTSKHPYRIIGPHAVLNDLDA